MGIVQSDHSKSYTLYIKVPNPIVTFKNFPSNEIFFKDLQMNIQHINLGSSITELPPEYSTILQKLFNFLQDTQSIKDLLKYSSPAECKDIESRLSQLETHLTTLNDTFQYLLQNGIEEEKRQNATTSGISACQEIYRFFSDENGFFYRNSFITSPYLVVFVGIYRSFLKLSGCQEQNKEMALVETTVENFKNKCIQERLDNIKMLRTQSESYNVHDYSYQAQVRKDVTFGGKINDFYDKRPINNITFRDTALNKASDADVILAGYKDEVKREYELFFETLH